MLSSRLTPATTFGNGRHDMSHELEWGILASYHGTAVAFTAYGWFWRCRVWWPGIAGRRIELDLL